MTMTVAVGAVATRYVGLLGTALLAAMALVFPFGMPVQMMSAGAMDGGLSSAVSRSLGANNPERARTLALHAVVIGAVAGLFISVLCLVFGPARYHALGCSGEVLEQAAF